MKQILIAILIIFGFRISCMADTWDDLIKESDKYFASREIDSALSKANQALKLATGDSPAKHAITLGKIGFIYFSTGKYDLATEYFLTEKNLKKTAYGREHPSYIITLNNLSSAYQFLGRYNDAELILLEAINIKKQTGKAEDSSLAKSLHNLAKLYQTLGRFEESEKLYNQSLEIKKNIFGESHKTSANTIFSLGLLYKQLGNNQSAEKFISKSLDIYKKNIKENSSEINLAEIQLAMVYLSMNKIEQASELIKNQNIAKDALDVNSPDYASKLYDFAMLQCQFKNYAEAESLLMKAKPAIEKQFGKTGTLFSACLNSLGIISWIQGKYEQAYKHLWNVVVVRELFYGENHPDYATSLFNLAGLLQDMKNYEQSEKNYKDALALTLKHIKNYFPFLSEKEKSRFFMNLKMRFDMFYNYVLLRFETNPKLIGDMYNYRLATKSIILNNTTNIRREIMASGDNEVLKKFEEWRKLREELSKLYNLSKTEIRTLTKNADSVELLANSIEKELSKSSTAFGNNLNKQAVTWVDIRYGLKADEAAVEIIRCSQFRKTENNIPLYIALIVTSESTEHPELIVMDDKNDLEKMYINGYRNSIKIKIKDDDSYKAFWSKLESKISDKKKIFISLDGVYNKINLNTLLKPDGKFLIDDIDIRIVPNTSDILTGTYQNISAENNKKEAVLFGNPKFNSDNQTITTNTMIAERKCLPVPQDIAKNKITELPGTKIEVENISKFLTENKWKFNLYMDENALKTTLKNIKNPGLLHIATHGYFLPENMSSSTGRLFGISSENSFDEPMLRSGLLFAGSENSINKNIFNDNISDNGIMTAYEVSNLDLTGTELVVLSACETGLGEIKNGEGVYGLQRAFQVAGAKSVIMSLWTVDDKTTQELMTNFYTNWLSGMSKQNAFKEAQLKLKQTYSNPYYWGAFVLIGDNN